MNLNPVRGAQIVLAYLGIGSLYLYKHPFLVKKDIIEGPYRLYTDLKKDLQKSEGNVEFKYKLRPPEGAIRPIKEK